MRKCIAAVAAVLVIPAVAALPADAGGDRKHGSFVARAVPFPAMKADIYYQQKGSCLEGMDGIHRVTKQFRAPAAGTLGVYIEDLSGDWDVYVLGTRGRQLGASDNAQVLAGAEGEERVKVAVKRHQRLQMVACNWLGEPEVKVHFDFVPKQTEAGKRRRHHSGSPSRAATHKVGAAGGPVTPLWEWDPSKLKIFVGDKVVWLNETSSEHHVTPYGGPWKDVDSMHLPVDGRVGFVFRKPGKYLYRCDFALAGVEHSVLLGDECTGMCGRIVVKRRR